MRRTKEHDSELNNAIRSEKILYRAIVGLTAVEYIIGGTMLTVTDGYDAIVGGICIGAGVVTSAVAYLMHRTDRKYHKIRNDLIDEINKLG